MKIWVYDGDIYSLENVRSVKTHATEGTRTRNGKKVNYVSYYITINYLDGEDEHINTPESNKPALEKAMREIQTILEGE